MKILSLTKYERLGASSRLRTLQYLPLLREKGVAVSSYALISDEALSLRYRLDRYSPSVLFLYARRIKTLFFKGSFDLIWIEKEMFPWFPAWVEILLLRGRPFILDYDDATFHNYDQNSNRFLRYFFSNKLDKLMKKSSLVICGNLYLRNRAVTSGALHTTIIPTVVDLNRYPVRKYSNFQLNIRDGYQYKIVWIGSPSTQHYLELIKKPLQSLSKKYNFVLRLIGLSDIDIPSVNVEILAWSEETESKLIRECDIGIMPLFNTPWEKGKCGYKLIQYMASGLPVVASPIGVNQEIVCHGDNGFLAHNENDWIVSLSNLLGDASLRSNMGLSGRQRVLEKYSLTTVTPNLIESFEGVYKMHNKESNEI